MVGLYAERDDSAGCDNQNLTAMLSSALIERLYQTAQAERWHVDRNAFAATLEASLNKAFPEASADSQAFARYLNGLHLQDLALACACANGHEEAWQHFIVTFRPVLYRASDVLDRGGGARECADAIYGDLYGVTEDGRARQSLFRYFHGRSSLATWLKAILSQRWVDRIRHQRRHESLPDEDVATGERGTEPQPERPRFLALMSVVLAAVMAGLDPRDRFRLNCYYARQLTLAQIGRLLNEHEATVSRQLARARRDIRRLVETRLAGEHQLGAAEIDACFAAVSDDPGPIDLRELLGAIDPPESDSVPRRKKAVVARSSEGRQP